MTDVPYIGFIGAGNMARSLIGGLLQHGHPPVRLGASEPLAANRERIAALGVQTSEDNAQIAAQADILVLAVKPQVLRDVLQPLANLAQTHRPLLLSIAAGVRTDTIAAWLGDASLPIVRAMPNTPALLGCGIAGLYANPHCDAQHKQAAARVLEAAGLVEWVAEEAQLDAVTAVSGSGPAYFFLLMEAMQAAGIELGLEPGLAARLTLQTALGAARMACESDAPPAELRRQVTSPGGTTAAALSVLESAGLRDAFERALTAARDRAATLADELAHAP